MPDHLIKPDRDEFDLRTALPPEPTRETLDGMRGRALSRARSARSRTIRTTMWRGVAVVAATVLAVWFLAASPAIENRAFARDEAADALVFARDGRVTHVVVRFRETHWNEEFGNDPRMDIDQRTEEWYDPANQRSYSKTINIADGSLDGVSVRVGEQEARFQNNVRKMTGAKPQLLAGETSLPFTSSLGFMTDQARAEIADGHAKVDGTRVVNGEECWVVVIDVNDLLREHDLEKPDPRSSDVITVTLRKSDYLITSWTRDSLMYNGNGKSTTAQSLEFERWELVAPEEIDASLFSVDAVRALAPEGTMITKTVDGAAVE